MTAPLDQDRLYTIAQAAEHIGVRSSILSARLRRWRKRRSGELPGAVFRDGQWYLSADLVHEMGGFERKSRTPRHGDPFETMMRQALHRQQ